MGGGNRERARRLWAKAVLTAAAIAIGLVHLAWPHLKIDLVTVALLAVALVPWLDRVFESIQTPFFSIKYRELEKRIDQVTENTERTKRLVEASETRELARQEVRSSGSEVTLVQLAAEYNRIRAEMPSSNVRTTAMTRVVGRMIGAIEAGDQLDVQSCLAASDPGLRLAAYVSLYVKPEPTMLIPLVDAVVSIEDKPFSQYWSLRALLRVITVGTSGAMDLNTLRRLRDFRRTLPAGSDRGRQLDQILQLVVD